MEGHFEAGPGLDGCLRLPHGLGGAIRLRGRGQIDGGVGQDEARLGQTDALYRLIGRRGYHEALGVGEADVLGSGDHQPAGDEARVLAGLEHLGDPEYRAIGIAAANALDEGGDGLIVVVAGLVVAHLPALDGRLDGLDRHGPAAGSGGRRNIYGRLQAVERDACIAAGGCDEQIERVGSHLHVLAA